MYVCVYMYVCMYVCVCIYIYIYKRRARFYDVRAMMRACMLYSLMVNFMYHVYYIKVYDYHYHYYC